MIVHGSTLSPFVRKVMAYLAEKSLTAERVPSGMGRGGPEFLKQPGDEAAAQGAIEGERRMAAAIG